MLPQRVQQPLSPLSTTRQSLQIQNGVAIARATARGSVRGAAIGAGCSAICAATRACAPMLRAARGAVVNVSSSSALDGTGSSPAYSASKAALNNLTINLARALAPQVRVNAVCPGFVETDWHIRGLGRERFDAVRQTVAQVTALQSTLSPDDVAESIVWMLGQPKMTGQHVLVDAGRQVGGGLALMQKKG